MSISTFVSYRFEKCDIDPYLVLHNSPSNANSNNSHSLYGRGLHTF